MLPVASSDCRTALLTNREARHWWCRQQGFRLLNGGYCSGDQPTAHCVPALVRPRVVEQLWPRLLHLRQKIGRPHLPLRFYLLNDVLGDVYLAFAMFPCTSSITLAIVGGQDCGAVPDPLVESRWIQRWIKALTELLLCHNTFPRVPLSKNLLFFCGSCVPLSHPDWLLAALRLVRWKIVNAVCSRLNSLTDLSFRCILIGFNIDTKWKFPYTA